MQTCVASLESYKPWQRQPATDQESFGTSSLHMHEVVVGLDDNKSVHDVCDVGELNAGVVAVCVM